MESEGSPESSEGASEQEGGVPGPPGFPGGASKEEHKGSPTIDAGNLSPTLPLMSASKSPRQGLQLCDF